MAAAGMAGRAEDIRRMPMGLHTIVSGGGAVSGGQRRSCSRPPVSAGRPAGAPCWATLPSSMTMTRSASSTADSRCAITTRVASSSRVLSITVRCVSLSRALVASSKKRIRGRRTSA
jgi:hypothetical protein